MKKKYPLTRNKSCLRKCSGSRRLSKSGRRLHESGCRRMYGFWQWQRCCLQRLRRWCQRAIEMALHLGVDAGFTLLQPLHQRITAAAGHHFQAYAFSSPLHHGAHHGGIDLALEPRHFCDVLQHLQEELKPTAGYVTDARRWLLDARPALAKAKVPAELLIRTR